MNNFLSNALSGNSNQIGGMSPLNILKQFDRNGDGVITEEDFVLAIERFGLGAVGEFAIKRVFRQLDTNRNGRLDLMEAFRASQMIQNIFNNGQMG